MENPPQHRSLLELPEDILREILTRLPPDEPRTLLRAAAVCRPWLRIFCEPVFRRRFREFHRVAPVTGYLVGHRESTNFVPTTPPAFTPGVTDLNAWQVLDARHGRVLLTIPLLNWLDVWDPVVDVFWTLPSPVADVDHDSYTATVLCADTECAHLYCYGPNFRVVAIMGNTTAGVTSGRTYSQATNMWTDLASVDAGVLLNMKPAAHLEHLLFFTTRSSLGRIVQYDLHAASISLVQPPDFQPFPPREFVLLPAATGGRLLLASMELSTVDLWEKDTMLNGSPWERRNRVSFLSLEHELLPGNVGTYLVGCCEGHGLLYFMFDTTLFSVNIDSGRVDVVFGDQNLDSVVPYQTFHTSEVLHRRLARFLLVG